MQLGFQRYNNFMTNDIHGWFREFCFRSEGLLFLSTNWWLWRARFIEILNGEDWDFPTIMRKITSFAQVLSIAAETMTPIRKNPRLVGWEKPPHGFAKLNIDGSYQGGIRSTGFGGLIKKDDGHWILVFSRNSGDSSVLHAELTAIMHGLRLARFISINQLVCHSNSKMAVDLIRTSVDEYHHYVGLVGDIRELLNEN